MIGTLTSVSALLLGAAFLLIGVGVQVTFLPIRAAIEGFSAIQIGLLGSSYYAGFVVGCIGAPYAILRAGHIRAFAAMVALTGAAVLGHALWLGELPWMAFRFITGMCLAGLYLVIESWLNDRATNNTRGLILSIYIFVNYTMLAVGQLLITFYAPEHFDLFAVSALLIALTAVPVVLTSSAQPAPVTLVHIDPMKLFRAAPVAMVGVVLTGAAIGSFWSLATVYAMGSGLTVDGAAVFMSVGVVGGALAQWPVGRLSDFVDRRQVLFWLTAAAAVVSAALTVLPVGGQLLMGLGFLFGATALPGYGIAAAHAYDRVESSTYVQTAAGVLLGYGAGSILGPLVASLLMSRMGPSGLFLFSCVVQIALAIYVLTRLRQRTAVTVDHKEGFDLAATSLVGSVISPEMLDPDDPSVGVPFEEASEPTERLETIVPDDAVSADGTSQPDDGDNRTVEPGTTAP